MIPDAPPPSASCSSCDWQAFEKGFKRAMFDRMDTGELDMGAPLWTRALCPAFKASIVPSSS